MSDSTTSIQDLKDVMSQFVSERDWHRFHAPKNLSMSMAIEAAELMEHFQWIEGPESRPASLTPKQLHDIGEELADVLCYALAMANELNFDIATIVQQKMVKNRIKYPIPPGGLHATSELDASDAGNVVSRDGEQPVDLCDGGRNR